MNLEIFKRVRLFYKCISRPVQIFESVDMKSYGVTIQMKATEQYSPVVLFIVLYKVVLT